MDIKTSAHTNLQGGGKESSMTLKVQIEAHHDFESASLPKVTSFEMEKEAIRLGILGFVADRLIPNILGKYGFSPSNISLSTSSKDSASTKLAIGSDNHGFELNGVFEQQSNFVNSREADPAEAVYVSRHAIAVNMANAIVSLLEDHFHQIASSQSETSHQIENGEFKSLNTVKRKLG